MTRFLRLAVAGFLAATAVAVPASAAGAGAGTASMTQSESAVGAKRAGRFMDRYLRHANREEWDWVREHLTRRMRQPVRVLRINGDYGHYRRSGRCWGYDESEDRTCTYLLSGEPTGEIGVRRRDDGAMRATGHVIYSCPTASAAAAGTSPDPGRLPGRVSRAELPRTTSVPPV